MKTKADAAATTLRIEIGRGFMLFLVEWSGTLRHGDYANRGSAAQVMWPRQPLEGGVEFVRGSYGHENRSGSGILVLDVSLSESIPRQHEVTALLNSLANPGSDSSTAAAQLLPLVYDELRDLARKMFGMRNRDQTLQPTALVHEAFVRLVRQGSPGWQSSEHFFNVAAMAMRQLLCDQARRRRAEKRGGDWNRVTLDEAFAPNVGSTVDLLELDEALTRLATECPRQARIVELRFLAGLSVDEAAHALSISPRTVENEWRFARAWLRRELERGLG